MTPYQLGQFLRTQVLLQQQRAGRAHGPRLVALLRDLCVNDHQDFYAPLCFLVTSPAFASALDRDGLLAGAALLDAWNRELAQIYASGLCLRLQPVLAGLLNLSPTVSPPVSPTAATPVRPAVRRRDPPGMVPPAAAARAGSTGRSSGARTVALTLLAFVGGVLLSAALTLTLGRGSNRRPSPDSPASLPQRRDPEAGLQRAAGDARPQVELPAAPAAPSRQGAADAPATTAAALAEDPAAPQRAISSVQQLYEALAARDYERARAYFSAAAADQFDPGYVEQYQQIAIQELRVTGQSGSTIQLEGVVSLVQSDGSRQLETRSFSVDVATEPPQVTASAFERVLR